MKQIGRKDSVHSGSFVFRKGICMKKEVLRRLDSLGRIVLPKDMRQKLLLNDGDPVEVTFEDESIVLRPYVPFTEMESFFSLCIRVAKRSGLLLVITSRTEVQFSFTNEIPKETPLPREISALITSRKIHDIHESKTPIVPNSDYRMQVICPIISYGELYGSIIAVDHDGLPLTDEQQIKLSLLCDIIAEEVSMK